MSGERKNTITKSATANTTTKKGLSQGQADILIAIVAMTWGCSYLLMKIGLTGMPPFSIIALRFCIAFITVALVFLDTEVFSGCFCLVCLLFLFRE